MPEEHITSQPPAANLPASLPSGSPPPAAAQQPPAGAGATPRRLWVWPASAVAFSAAFVVVLGLLNARDMPPKQPEQRPAAAALDPQPAHDDAGQIRLEDWLRVNRSAGPLSPDVIYADASPCVVLVRTYDRASRPTGFGSGFVVSSDGLIATNHHVIRTAHSAHVVFGDDSQRPVRGVAAADPESDLVLLKIDGTNLPGLSLASGNVPPVGAKVYAIGNPEGLRNTLSDGLVSRHRGAGDVPALIQTTAAISPGSSGGPLLSDRGEVVGITTLSFVKGQNLNLAVPASRLVAMLRRRNPLQPLDTLAHAGRPPEEEWSPWDKRNLTLFFCALKGENDAAKQCLAKRNLTQQDLQGYGYQLLISTPFYARLVDADLLRKVHPELPQAFRENFLGFVESAERRIFSRAAITPDSLRSRGAWRQWWAANKQDLHFPDELPVLREFGLTDEWARQWKDVRFPRFVPE
jgi:hypothetical protein